MPVRLIFGKSLVGGTATSDVFEGIQVGADRLCPGAWLRSTAPGLTLELGGPWAFYRAFWPSPQYRATCRSLFAGSPSCSLAIRFGFRCSFAMTQMTRASDTALHTSRRMERETRRDLYTVGCP